MSRAKPLKRWPAAVVAALATTLSLVAIVAPQSAQASASCPDTLAVNRPNVSGGGIGYWTNCGTVYHGLTDPVGPADHWPAISPDHSKVAFTRFFQDSTSEVFVVPFGGGTPVQVTNFGQNSFGQIPDTAWSPDSSQLAVNLSDTGKLYKVKADGSSTTLLYAGVISTGVAWCGSKIVFPGSTDLFSVSSSDGSGLTQITTGPAAFRQDPACSPNNQYVFYDGVEGTSSTSNIYVVPLTGGASVRLTTGTWDASPTVSNDWALAYKSQDTGSIMLQQLGGTQTATGPAGDEPSFTPGDGTIAPPVDFPTPGANPPTSCPTVQIYGVRGSRAADWDVDDVDKETTGFAVNVAGQIPGVKFTPIKYPATKVDLFNPVAYAGNYPASVNEGYDTLDTALGDFLATCTHAYVILVGYSQGAHVAGDVFDAQILTDKQRIILVMFGDPLFSPYQPSVDQPQSGKWTYSSKLSGVYQFYTNIMRSIPASSIANVRSYCLKGDPVCNYSKPNAAACVAKLSTCPHMFYQTKGWTTTASNWAVTRWRQLPAI